jgi:hypothetical protein
MVTKSSNGASRGKKIKGLRAKTLTSRQAKAVKGGFEIKDYGFGVETPVTTSGAGTGGTQKK